MIFLKDQLDCNEDPCHLAWIFNQNLMSSIFNAQCSNGTYFRDLDPKYFVECYVRNSFLRFFSYSFNCIVQVATTTESSTLTESTSMLETTGEYTSTAISNWFNSKITSSQSQQLSITSTNVNCLFGLNYCFFLYTVRSRYNNKISVACRHIFFNRVHLSFDYFIDHKSVDRTIVKYLITFIKISFKVLF